MREGIRYTAAHPGIAALLVLLVALGVGGRPLNELLPGFAADVFHSGRAASRSSPRRSAAEPFAAAFGLATVRVRPS